MKNLHKPYPADIAAEIAAAAALNGHATPTSVRWPTPADAQQQQQQARQFQQLQPQAFYPAISPASIGLPYPGKMPVSIVLGWKCSYIVW